jgi:hypothetical protein
MKASSRLKSIEIHASIIRADGSVEPLGPIAYYHQSRWRRWCWRLRQTLMKGARHG